MRGGGGGGGGGIGDDELVLSSLLHRHVSDARADSRCGMGGSLV